MELSPKSCRICLTETDFNVSLFSSYCIKKEMVNKILICLKLVIEETDVLNTICYKCAENIERYYDFIMFVKKSQTKLAQPRAQTSLSRRHVTSYVREQVIDADYTFSFLDIPEEEHHKNKPTKASSPFFSYFSPPASNEMKHSKEIWKTPKIDKQELRRDDMFKRPKENRHLSRDLFDSQSQDVEPEPKSLDWNLTPDENILKRVRNKCFGRSEF